VLFDWNRLKVLGSRGLVLSRVSVRRPAIRIRETDSSEACQFAIVTQNPRSHSLEAEPKILALVSRR
jgi:hypothetical protein